MEVSVLRASVDHSVNTSMHTHSYFQLVYCKKSGGWITVGNTVYQAEAHHVYFAKPNIPHRYEQCEKKHLLEIMFHANGRLAENLDKLPDHFCPADPTLSEMLLDRITAEYTEGQVYFYDIIHCALRFFLIDALRQCHASYPRTENAGEKADAFEEDDDALVLNLKHYIDNHLHENLTLDALAEQAHFSKTYFVYRFKSLYGVTPIQYINNLRYQRATTLLMNTDMSVSDISAKVGFRTPHYFSTFFKKYSGVSPKVFRSRDDIAHRKG